MENKKYFMLGGVLEMQPAGEAQFNDKETGQPVNAKWPDRVVLSYDGRTYRIPLPAVAAFINEVKDNKEVQAAIGVKLGVF